MLYKYINSQKLVVFASDALLSDLMLLSEALLSSAEPNNTHLGTIINVCHR